MRKHAGLALMLLPPAAQAEDYTNMARFLLPVLAWGSLALLTLLLPILWIAVTSTLPKRGWLMTLLLIDAAALAAGTLGALAVDIELLASPWLWLAINLPSLVVTALYLNAARHGRPSR